jgi:hypothetical protein
MAAIERHLERAGVVASLLVMPLVAGEYSIQYKLTLYVSSCAVLVVCCAVLKDHCYFEQKESAASSSSTRKGHCELRFRISDISHNETIASQRAEQASCANYDTVT